MFVGVETGDRIGVHLRGESEGWIYGHYGQTHEGMVLLYDSTKDSRVTKRIMLDSIDAVWVQR